MQKFSFTSSATLQYIFLQPVGNQRELSHGSELVSFSQFSNVAAIQESFGR